MTSTKKMTVKDIFTITVISLMDEKHSDTVFREMEKIFRSKYKKKLTESLQDFGGRNKHALNVITEYRTGLHLKMDTKETLAALSGDNFVILTDPSSLLLGQAMKETITEAKKTLTGMNVPILVKGIPMDCLSAGNCHCEPVDRRPLVVSGVHQIGSQCLIPSHDTKMASNGDDLLHLGMSRTRADIKQTVSKLRVKIKSRRKRGPGVSTSEPLTEDWSNSHEQPWNYQHAAKFSTEKEDEVHQVINQCLVLSHEKITQKGDVNVLNLDMFDHQRSSTGSFIKQSVSTLWEKMKSRRRSLPFIKTETSTDDHTEDGICEEDVERRTDDVNNGSMLDERSVSRKHLNTENTRTYTRQKIKSRRRTLSCIKTETSTDEDVICEEDVERRSDDVNNGSMLDERSVSRKHLNTENTRTYTRQKMKSRRRSLSCIKTETSTDEDSICEEDVERRTDDVNNGSMLDERSVLRKHLNTEYTRTYTRQKMKSRRRSLPCIKNETSTYDHIEDVICEEDIEGRSDDINNGSMLDERSVSRKHLNTEYTSTYIRQFDEVSSLTRHLESRLSKLKNDTDRMFTQMQPARSTNNVVKGDTPVLVSKALNFQCERVQNVLSSSSSNTSKHLNSSTKKQEQVKELSGVSKDGLQMMCEDTRDTSYREPSRMKKGKTCLPSESVSPINRYQFPKVLHEVRSKKNKQPSIDPSIPICIKESLQTPAAVLGFSKTKPWCDSTVSLSDSLFEMEISEDDNKRRLLKECPTEPEEEQDDLIQEVLLAKAKGGMDFAIEDIFEELCQLLKHSSSDTCTKRQLDLP